MHSISLTYVVNVRTLPLPARVSTRLKILGCAIEDYGNADLVEPDLPIVKAVRHRPPINPEAPKLTKLGYFTVPAIKQLKRMPNESLKASLSNLFAMFIKSCKYSPQLHKPNASSSWDESKHWVSISLFLPWKQLYVQGLCITFSWAVYAKQDVLSFPCLHSRRSALWLAERNLEKYNSYFQSIWSMWILTIW